MLMVMLEFNLATSVFAVSLLAWYLSFSLYVAFTDIVPVFTMFSVMFLSPLDRSSSPSTSPVVLSTITT